MEYAARSRYLNIKEAATRYDVSRGKLHRMIRLGKMKPIQDPRDARAVLLRLDDLEELFRFPEEDPEALGVETTYDVGTTGGVEMAGRITAELRARLDVVRERAAIKYGTSDDSVEITQEEREMRTDRLMEAVEGAQGESDPGGQADGSSS